MDEAGVLTHKKRRIFSKTLHTTLNCAHSFTFFACLGQKEEIVV